MTTSLAKTIESKNALVKEYRAEKYRFDGLLAIFKPLAKGISIRIHSVTYSISEELERLEALTDDLEGSYVETGLLSPDDDYGYWSEASYTDFKTNRRILKIQTGLLDGKYVDIPDDLKEFFPKQGTEEFIDYIENLKYRSEISDDEELSNIQQEIREWIESYSDWVDCVEQGSDWSNDEDSRKAKKLISNLATLWSEFIRSIDRL